MIIFLHRLNVLAGYFTHTFLEMTYNLITLWNIQKPWHRSWIILMIYLESCLHYFTSMCYKWKSIFSRNCFGGYFSIEPFTQIYVAICLQISEYFFSLTENVRHLSPSLSLFHSRITQLHSSCFTPQPE